MLIEIWERLRGYDKWIQTEARIESSQIKRTTGFPASWVSKNKLVWSDRSGEAQRANLTVPDSSPLYKFIEGEAMTIRYNPAEPDRFYLPELLRTRVHTALLRTLNGLYYLGIILLLLWDLSRHHR